MTEGQEPSDDGAKTSVRGDMSYGDYLCVDDILSSQRPLSNAHDEMLFII
jgi:tryptophan 2,3-dioxygenase